MAAENAELKLFIEGKDMTNDIGIISAVHDTYAADYVDTIVCGLQDKEGKWSKWRPKAGEEMEVTLSTCKTGRMWIHKVTSTNGVYYVTARSMPPGKNSVRTREWEGTTFAATGQLIASELGLSFENHGCSDQSYKRLYQMGEKNTEFFRRLCHQEGVEMTIFDGKLVAYDESALEHAAPSQKIDFTGHGDFDFTRGEGDKVGSVQVLRTIKRNGTGCKDNDFFKEYEEIMVDTGHGDFDFTRGEGDKVGSVQVLRTIKRNGTGCKDNDFFKEYEEIMVDQTFSKGEFTRGEGDKVGSVQVLRTIKRNGTGCKDNDFFKEYEEIMVDQTFSKGEGRKITYDRLKPNDDGRTIKRNGTGCKDNDFFKEYEEIMVDQTFSKGEGRKITYDRLKPNDDGEARRWAQGLLKNANKYSSTGRFRLSLQTGLAAGSVVEIKNDRASEWNGAVFLYRVKHDYRAQESTLYFRAIAD